MDFNLSGDTKNYNSKIVGVNEDGSFNIDINGEIHNAKLIRFSSRDIEFISDNQYFTVGILESNTEESKLSIEGTIINLKKHTRMSEVLKKSLRLTDLVGGDNKLTSQIPGRVVKVLSENGSSIKKDDPIVVLESMKMQVAVKSHKDGVIKEISVKPGSIVNRSDLIAIIE